ncbi:hypothetical protein ACF0H5_002717 [Mactra antiquata]
MFKAIGRWGSQVKNTLNVHIFSNIFGSKSKRYGDLHNDEEEIFCDAQEEIFESENEDDHVPQTPVVTNGDIAVKADINLNNTIDVPPDNVDSKAEETEITTQAEVSSETNVESNEINKIEDLVTFDFTCNDDDAVEAKVDDNNTSKDDDKKSDSDNDSGDTSDDEHHGDDDHHVNHSDKTKIMKNSKSSNGLVQSASATVIQKVHRRMNSYSQRQYAKFDNAQDDENDNVIQNEEVTSHDDVDNNVFDRYDETDQKSDKKTKRKKKVAFFSFFRGFFSFGSRSKSTRVR